MNWLPGYEWQPIQGAGHNPTPGNRKVILHTTEGMSADHWIREWRKDWASGLPHFVVEDDRCVQLLPLDTCAYTSKNGGINANKAGCPIQVEVCAKASVGFNDATYRMVGRWIADLIQFGGLTLDLDACPRFYGEADRIYPYLATAESPVRDFTRTGYAELNTIIGHQHLWGQDHWDPGPIDIHRICDIARRHLGAGRLEQGDALDMAEPKDVIDPLANKMDLLFAKLGLDLADTIEKARVSIIVADTQNAENVAGVVRGEEGTTRATLTAALEAARIEGALPADTDIEALATAVAPHLTVTPKN